MLYQYITKHVFLWESYLSEAKHKLLNVIIRIDFSVVSFNRSYVAYCITTTVIIHYTAEYPAAALDSCLAFILMV